MAMCFISSSFAAGFTGHHLHMKSTASLTLLAAGTVDYGRESQNRRLCASTKVFSWRSSASYIRTSEGITGLVSRLKTTKSIALNRKLILKSGTIEEIEAEKSVVEEEAREKMEKAIETVRSNFNTVRAGRANPAMLDGIEVEYYGTPVTLKSIAQISTPDASSLLVNPFDKSSLKIIEKAIVGSNLGFTPKNDGEALRLGIPSLTSERRKELSKLVAKQAEEGKVAIRNIRRDAIKACEKLEKEKKLSEDNAKDLTRDLQKVTDEYMKKMDSLLKQKEKELLTI